MRLPVHDYLDRREIPYQAKTFPDTIAKGAANVARALGFRERQMVKTLIFKAREEYVLVMVGGDQVAVSRLLKKAIGSRNIQMAKPDQIEAVTGYQVGSIPPFHWQPTGFRSFLETSLLGEPELGVGTGRWGHEIIIAPANLVKASQATVVNLTDSAKIE